jgi:hypothetical protein
MTDLMESLKGHKFRFYGVDNTRFKLDDVVYEAKEDESDGYRSYLESIQVVLDCSSIFFKRPVASVTVRDAVVPRITNVYDDGLEGWELVDDSGHVWLLVGTDRSDGYYPFFTFRYTPK